MAIPDKVQQMRNLAAFTGIVALGNLGVTIWHLRLASELNPALSFPEAARIGALTVVLTLVGISLLWTQRMLAGSLLLVVVFAIDLVIGSLEHFFIPGPNNVFDTGGAVWRSCSGSAWRCSSLWRLPAYGVPRA
jgi:hypothetical protein